MVYDLLTFNLTTFTSHLLTILITIYFINLFINTSAPKLLDLKFLVLNTLTIFFLYNRIEKTSANNKWGFILSTPIKELHTSLIGAQLIIYPLIGLFACLKIDPLSIWFIFPVASLLTMMTTRKKFANFYFDVVAQVSYSIFTLGVLIYLLLNNQEQLTTVIHICTLLIIGVVNLITSESVELNQKILWPGWFGIWTALMVGIYLLINPINPLIATMALLFFITIFFEIKNTDLIKNVGSNVHNNLHQYFAITNILTVVVMLIHFFTLSVQNEEWIGPIKMRGGVEFFIVATLIYIFSKKNSSLDTFSSKISNYALEGALTLVYIFISFEFNQSYKVVMLAILSLITFYFGSKSSYFKRLIIYSFLIYLLMLFNIAGDVKNLV